MPTIDGIVSGLDTTSLINAILTAHTVSINTLKAQSSDTARRQQAVAGVKNTLTTLSDAIKAMDTPAEFNATTVASSSSQFKVTADTGALVGAYAIRVANLATAQTSVSDGVDDKNAAIFGTGTFGVTIGSTTTNLTVDNTNNSLAGMAAALNKMDGISAYVIDTGASVGRYKLLVQGSSTGVANGFSLDAAGLSGGTPPAFQTTSAVDAAVEVGGVTIHVASNTLDGAIPGIKIELIQPGATADTAVVTQDPTAMQAKMKKVIDAYNAALDYRAQQSVYNPAQDLKGPLAGEGSTRRALNDLGSTITNQFTVAGTGLKSLAELGVKTAQDGHLSLDEAVFSDKLAADPKGVTTFLTDAAGPLAVVRDKIDNLYVDEVGGSLTATVTGLGQTVTNIDDQVTRATDRMNAQAEILRSRFAAMEVTLGNLKTTSSYLSSIYTSTKTSG